MGKLIILLTLLAYAFAAPGKSSSWAPKEEDCGYTTVHETVTEKKCDTEHKEKCTTKYETKYETETKEECTTAYEKVTEYKTEEKCETKDVKKIEYKTEQECNTVYKDECHEEKKCKSHAKPSYGRQSSGKPSYNPTYERKKRSATYSYGNTKPTYQPKKECKTVRTCKKVPEKTCEYVKKPYKNYYGKVEYKKKKECKTTYTEECHEEEKCETEKPSYTPTYYRRKKRSATYQPKKECKTVKTCQKVPEEECKYVKKPHTDHYGKVQYKTEEICTTTYKDECHEEVQCETEKPSYSNTYYGRKKRSASTYDRPSSYGKTEPTYQPKTKPTYQPKQECKTVEICEQVPEKKCKDVKKSYTNYVPKTTCKDVDVPYTKEVPKKVCVDKHIEVKKEVPRKECNQVPYEVCKTVTKKVPTKVKKPCNQPGWSKKGH